MFKYFCSVALLAGLYSLLGGLDTFGSEEAALVITGFAGLWLLFILVFVMRDDY